MKHFRTIDPAPALHRLRIPVLALYGEKDLQTPPALNARALSLAGPRAEVRGLPGRDHMFQTAQIGLSRGYGRIEETLAPSALRAVCDWIMQQRWTTPSGPKRR